MQIIFNQNSNIKSLELVANYANCYSWYDFKPKYTTFSSEVGFQDQLLFLSDDFSLEIELISHQKQSKVHLQNELWKFYLYNLDFKIKITISVQFLYYSNIVV